MIVFDTETTGLVKSLDLPDARQPKIIEFFGLKLDREFNELATLHLLFDPGERLSDEIVKITGITDATLRGALPFAMHQDELARFFLGEDLVVGHNVTFDLDMLYLELRRCGRVTSFPWPPTRLCTVEATEHLQGRRMRLADLHERLFEEGFDSAHRAEADVRATARCLRRLVETQQAKLPQLVVDVRQVA